MTIPNPIFPYGHLRIIERKQKIPIQKRTKKAKYEPYRDAHAPAGYVSSALMKARYE
jgi:hypothetical protein